MAQGSSFVAGRRTHPLTAIVQSFVWGGAAIAGLSSVVFSGNITEAGDIGSFVVDNAIRFLVIPAGVLLGALFGGAAWWFTTYTINEAEFRVDSGVIAKKSRRVPFERIQSVDIAEPLLARIFKLAELRVESAGGEGSRTTLRYVPTAEARRLRSLLLELSQGVASSDPADTSAIAHIAPARLVLATVLSLDFALTAGVATLAMIAMVWTGYWWLAGAFVVPAGSWLLHIVIARVISQWDFELDDAEGGLRLRRGLLSRTSQSVPFDRVQGVRVEEPFLWRLLGWQRLTVDIAGYNLGKNESAQQESTLLPISDRDLAQYVLNRLIPGVQSDALSCYRPGTAVFAPIGWRFRILGATEIAVFNRGGWIYRTTSWVPHGKVQSIAVRQGPLQRLFGVAGVHVHTPDGPVNVVGRHLRLADGFAFADAELERARIARTLHPPEMPSSAPASTDSTSHESSQP